MKRILISFAFSFLFLSVTHAQPYNKRFFDTRNLFGTLTGEFGYDIVDAGNGNTCVLSVQWEHINLKMLDFAGNVSGSETFYMPLASTPPARAYLGERLLTTPNGEFIVAGRCLYQPTHQSLIEIIPFAARFNFNGTNFTCLWFEEYPGNGVIATSLSNIPESRINIVRAEDAPSEAYILVTEGDDTNTPLAGSGLFTINALQIDANGNLNWNKKYSDNTGSGTLRDYHVSALAYGENNEQPSAGKYFIGGSIDRQTSFDMTIDFMGNIIDQYREYDMPGEEFDHSVLFDDNQQQFVLANSISSMNAGNSIHQIAVTKIDISMAILQTDFYYENDPASFQCSTISKKIIEDDTKSHYLVTGSTHRDYNGTGTIHAGISILKLDKFANVQFFKRYNRLGGTWGYSIASVVDPFTTTENYAATGQGANTRVLTTDITGSTCGEEDLSFDQSDFSLSSIQYIHTVDSFVGQQSVTYSVGNSYREVSCDPLNPYYKPTSIENTDVSGNNIQVYPNVLSYNERFVNIDLSTISSTDFSVSVYSIDGRQIASKEFTAEAGKKVLQFDTGIEVAGTYILRIESNIQELVKTVKISKY